MQTNPSCLAESTETEIGFVLTSPLLKSATWQDDRATQLRGAAFKSVGLQSTSLGLLGRGQYEFKIIK